MAEAIAERSPGGRYIRFLEKLGSGASKDVYRAYDTQEGIEVAWNVVNLSGVPKNERNRIVSEVRLLESLHHHNIISFHGSWVNRVRQEVHFVTEILSSGTLKSFINKVQVIRWKIAKRWAYQILKGLEYLHSQGVIHRDLKCDNIFINGTSGDLRIGDLGLSTVHRNGRVLSVLGTPEFMAPDMYEEKSYDERVDIYSFGMCMLEIFTQEIPYSECQNPAQIYRKVSKGHLPLSLGRIQNIEAREFIMQCLGYKDPQTGLYVRPTASQLLKHDFLLKAEDDDWIVGIDPPLERMEVNSSSSDDEGPDPLCVQQQMQYRGEQEELQKAQAKLLRQQEEGQQPSQEAAQGDDIESHELSSEEEDKLLNMAQNEDDFRNIKVLGGRGKEMDYKPDAKRTEEGQSQQRQEQRQVQKSQMEQLRQDQRDAQFDLNQEQLYQQQLLKEQQDQELKDLKDRQLLQHQEQRNYQLQQQEQLIEEQVQELRSKQQQQLQQQSMRLQLLQQKKEKPSKQQAEQQPQQQPMQGHLLQQHQMQQQLQEQQRKLQQQMQQLQMKQQQQQHMAAEARQQQGSHGSKISQQSSQPSQLSYGSHPSQASHSSKSSQQQQIAEEPLPHGSYGSRMSHASRGSQGSHTSQGSKGSRRHYLTAAAVVEDEDLVADQQFADNYLKLIITLPIHGHTQNVQFDFHLTEDDPVVVATEMVEELGIPQPAILEISDTINGLATAARLRRDNTRAKEQERTSISSRSTTTDKQSQQQGMNQETQQPQHNVAVQQASSFLNSQQQQQQQQDYWQIHQQEQTQMQQGQMQLQQQQQIRQQQNRPGQQQQQNLSVGHGGQPEPIDPTLGKSPLSEIQSAESIGRNSSFSGFQHQSQTQGQYPAAGSGAAAQIDEAYNEELRILDEEYRKTLVQANEMYDQRRGDLRGIIAEREAEHEKALQKHERERLQMEEQMLRDEKDQNVRLEQLHREWDERRETLGRRHEASVSGTSSGRTNSSATSGTAVSQQQLHQKEQQEDI